MNLGPFHFFSGCLIWMVDGMDYSSIFIVLTIINHPNLMKIPSCRGKGKPHWEPWLHSFCSLAVSCPNSFRSCSRSSCGPPYIEICVYTYIYILYMFAHTHTTYVYTHFLHTYIYIYDNLYTYTYRHHHHLGGRGPPNAGPCMYIYIYLMIYIYVGSAHNYLHDYVIYIYDCITTIYCNTELKQ